MQRIGRTSTGVVIWAVVKTLDAVCPRYGQRSSKAQPLRPQTGGRLGRRTTRRAPITDAQVLLRRRGMPDEDVRRTGRRNDPSTRAGQDWRAPCWSRSAWRWRAAPGRGRRHCSACRRPKTPCCVWSYALPDPEFTNVRVLGVDDFVLRRGHVYGTVLIDIESNRRCQPRTVAGVAGKILRQRERCIRRDTATNHRRPHQARHLRGHHDQASRSQRKPST